MPLTVHAQGFVLLAKVPKFLVRVLIPSGDFGKTGAERGWDGGAAGRAAEVLQREVFAAVIGLSLGDCGQAKEDSKANSEGKECEAHDNIILL